MADQPNAADARPDTKTTTWPYTSFRTLLNLFERLEAAKAIPPKIDRSFLGGSEGQKTQVISALKFLGMIEDDGAVLLPLKKIVNAPAHRAENIRELLAKYYPAATALAAQNATTSALEETFTGLSGDTRRKAIAFYLHAAKFANHPVSKFFKAPTGVYAKRKPRGNTAPNTPPAPPPPPPAAPAVDARARYIDMLMEKAAATTDAATEKDLLDRIERVLALQDGSNPKRPAE